MTSLMIDFPTAMFLWCCLLSSSYVHVFTQPTFMYVHNPAQVLGVAFSSGNNFGPMDLTSRSRHETAGLLLGLGCSLWL